MKDWFIFAICEIDLTWRRVSTMSMFVGSKRDILVLSNVTISCKNKRSDMMFLGASITNDHLITRKKLFFNLWIIARKQKTVFRKYSRFLSVKKGKPGNNLSHLISIYFKCFPLPRFHPRTHFLHPTTYISAYLIATNYLGTTYH